MAVDETWVHYYEPENKAQSPMGRAQVTKAKEEATFCWHVNGHIYVFWDTKSDILLDDLLKKRTITGEYYANLLNREPQSMRKKRQTL